jgi:hypothetical protein
MRQFSRVPVPARPRRRASAATAVLFTALLLPTWSAPLIAAQNLLSDGEFSAPTSPCPPWQVSQGTCYLSNLDHSNNTSSGSIRIAHPGSFVGSLLLSPCLAIQGGAQADVGGYFRTASSNSSGSKLRIGRSYYTDSTCKTYVSGTNSGYLVAPSSWTSVTNAGKAPTNAKYVRLEVAAVSSTANEAFDLLADGLYVNSAGTSLPDLLFKNGFEGGTTSGWNVVQ